MDDTKVEAAVEKKEAITVSQEGTEKLEKSAVLLKANQDHVAKFGSVVISGRRFAVNKVVISSGGSGTSFDPENTLTTVFFDVYLEPLTEFDPTALRLAAMELLAAVSENDERLSHLILTAVLMESLQRGQARAIVDTDCFVAFPTQGVNEEALKKVIGNLKGTREQIDGTNFATVDVSSFWKSITSAVKSQKKGAVSSANCRKIVMRIFFPETIDVMIDYFFAVGTNPSKIPDILIQSKKIGATYAGDVFLAHPSLVDAVSVSGKDAARHLLMLAQFMKQTERKKTGVKDTLGQDIDQKKIFESSVIRLATVHNIDVGDVKAFVSWAWENSADWHRYEADYETVVTCTWGDVSVKVICDTIANQRGEKTGAANIKVESSGVQKKVDYGKKPEAQKKGGLLGFFGI